MKDQVHTEEERRAEQDRARDAARQADRAQNDMMEMFKQLLGWLFDWIFGEDPEAPNESVEDMAPVSAGEKVRQAHATIDSRALPKWNAFKSEHQGGAVQHSSPIPQHAVVTSGKGPRSISVGSRNHQGIDIDVTQGETAPILASAEGVVLFSGRKGGYGNTVIIGHGDGTRTLYAHMTGENMPNIGDKIKRDPDTGQLPVIGQMGNTGLKGMKVHLHYEQWSADGTKITPVINGQRMHKHDTLNAGHQHAGADHDHDDDKAPKAAPTKLAGLKLPALKGVVLDNDDNERTASAKPKPVTSKKVAASTLGNGKLEWSDATETMDKAGTAFKSAATKLGSLIGLA